MGKTEFFLLWIRVNQSPQFAVIMKLTTVSGSLVSVLAVFAEADITSVVYHV